jgi:hypothetical protein
MTDVQITLRRAEWQRILDCISSEADSAEARHDNGDRDVSDYEHFTELRALAAKLTAALN